MKIAVKRCSKAIKKLEKSCRWCKIVPFLGQIEIKIPVLVAAASPASTCTAATFFHEVPDGKVHGDGALTIAPSSSPAKGGTINL